MKKLVFVLVIALLLVGCGPTDAECESAWGQLEVGSEVNANAADYDSYDEYAEAFAADVAFTVNIILNGNWAPDSIGFAVKECINSGWDGYR